MDTDMWLPPVCRGMKYLDRTQFHKNISLQAARIRPELIAKLQSNFPKEIFRAKRVKRVYEEGDKKLVLLQSTSSDLQNFLRAHDADIIPYTVTLDYDFWNTDSILKAVLPEKFADNIPGSFTGTGHIAHMNLQDEFLPYKNLIGQVILDKNERITMVVNKIDTIDTSFRTFKMEVLASSGDINYIVDQKESGCRFRFDFENVYWNSRLQGEHGRLIDQFKRGEVIADVFAGVGPFAVPAGKKMCFVLANDLNTHSYKWLKHNIVDNKVTDTVIPYCLDGKEFIKKSIDEIKKYAGSVQRIHNKKKQEITVHPWIDHYVMNLPATAINFLSAFRDMQFDKSQPPPLVHVYSFSGQKDIQEAKKELLLKASQEIGRPVKGDIWYVRNVAPNKVCNKAPLETLLYILFNSIQQQQ